MENIGHLKHLGDTYRIEVCRPHPRDWLNFLFLNHGQRGQYKVGKVPMVSLHNHGRLKLGGLYLPESDRGGILSRVLLEIAFRVTESTGTELRHTAIVRKPLVANLLCKYGFEPDVASTTAEILPKKGESPVPKVRLSTRKKTLDNRPEWFEIVPGEPDPNSGNPIVGLYTSYTLIDEAKALRAREETVAQIDGLLRIFPRRVERHLSLPF